MKRALCLILILLVLPTIIAVEFDMQDSFDQGETLLAKISGNFINPILEENILFYRGHVRVAIDASVAKIDDDFYIYALLNKEQNNYSIKIENIQYMQGNKIVDDDLVKEFVITENIADFSVEPGFIMAEDDFSIQVQNLQDSSITIDVKTETTFGSSKGFFESLFGSSSETTDQTSVTLKSGEIEKIDFNVGEITEPTLKKIILSTDNLEYEVPVYIYGVDEKPKERKYKFEPAEIDILMPTNSNKTKIIYLYNNGEADLENISLSASKLLKPYVSFSIDEIEELEANSSIKIELYLSSNYEEQEVEGQITAKATPELYTYSAVFLNFIKDYVPLDNETETPDPTTPLIIDDNEEGSSTGKIIGWFIVGAIVIFLVWFFAKKYRGKKKPVDLLKIAGGKK